MNERDALHRMLHLSFIEMRVEAYEIKNEKVFHIADLLHNMPLQMERAAQGQVTYDEILKDLEATAKRKGCESWLESILSMARRPRRRWDDAEENSLP